MLLRRSRVILLVLSLEKLSHLVLLIPVYATIVLPPSLLRLSTLPFWLLRLLILFCYHNLSDNLYRHVLSRNLTHHPLVDLGDPHVLLHLLLVLFDQRLQLLVLPPVVSLSLLQSQLAPLSLSLNLGSQLLGLLT